MSLVLDTVTTRLSQAVLHLSDGTALEQLSRNGVIVVVIVIVIAIVIAIVAIVVIVVIVSG
mgnify:CR=1 FL=1